MKLLSVLLLLAASTTPLLALPQGEIEMPPLCPLLQAQHELLVQHINDPLYCDPPARMLGPHDCSRKRTIRKFLRNERRMQEEKCKDVPEDWPTFPQADCDHLRDILAELEGSCALCDSDCPIFVGQIAKLVAVQAKCEFSPPKPTKPAA